MKKTILSLVLLLLSTMAVQAQTITDLSQLKTQKKYLLENANGYGYCIYNPNLSDKDAMLGGIVVPHHSGVAQDAYYDPVSPMDASSQWQIADTGKGTYYLYNYGAQQYLTNETSGGGWWGASYGTYYFTSTPAEFDIESYSDGVWTFRLTAAANSFNADKMYLCAASHSYTPMSNWQASDIGSQWYIKEVIEQYAESIKLSKSVLSLVEGKTATLTATVKPADAPGASMVVWSSSDDKVATVEDGLVTAIAAGTCTVYAKVNDGSEVEDSCQVIVTEPEKEDLGRLHYFTLTDGQMVVIPENYIEGRTLEDGIVTIALKGDTTFTYRQSLLASEDTIYNGSLPEFESFKFNNKFNDQLHTDADGVIDSLNNTIRLSVACIGKRLTPSFKVPEGAHAYVNNVQQFSKVTRRRFDKDLIYTLAYPKNWIYRVEKISDEVWSTPPEVTDEPWIIEPVSLTSEMLSTNWPGTDPAQELPYVIDGDLGTNFHSNYSSSNNWYEGAYYGDSICTWPYLQVELPDSLEALQFNYTTRNWNQNNGYSPLAFIFMASKDGEQWDDIRKFEQERDGLPLGASKSYESPVVELGKPYKFIRLQLTESSRKNYLVLAEFSLNSATPNPDYGKSTEDFVPELLAPAQYAHTFVPFGRDYTVHVDFLTDHSESEYNVPSISINTFDGMSITSRTEYKEASFELYGAGIWDDIKIDTMLIRGRGNSSWGGGYTKEPYRMKFPEKIKPFGLTKGKSWVLLANKQSRSMTTNAIAMKIADMVESAACNHIIPVDVYVNGEYRGSYNFTENPGFASNSIKVDDEAKAAMVELDSYYDEPYKFRSSTFNLPVNVKEPDFSDPETITELSFEDIQEAFNKVTEGIYMGDFEPTLDVEMLAKAMLVTDLVRNTETQHPKSWRVYNPDVLSDSTAWVFGPVWDFDWSYGYEGHSQYFIYDAETSLVSYTGKTGNTFFKAILENSEVFQKEYYRQWTNFLKRDCLGELVEFCDDYYNFVKPSFVHNSERWSDGKEKDYTVVTTNAKNWLTKRANWIYSNLTPFDLSDDVDDTPVPDDYGQPDRIDLAKVINTPVDVYTLGGIRIRTRVPYINATTGLMPGIYIVNGKKVAIK